MPMRGERKRGVVVKLVMPFACKTSRRLKGSKGKLTSAGCNCDGGWKRGGCRGWLRWLKKVQCDFTQRLPGQGQFFPRRASKTVQEYMNSITTKIEHPSLPDDLFSHVKVKPFLELFQGCYT